MFDAFEPLSLGPLTARNRLVRSATWLGLASPGGAVTDALVERYRELGAGGVGTVITGYAAVSPGGRQMPRMLGIHDDELVPGLTRIAAAIQAGGALAGIQLVHAGGQTQASWLPGGTPVAPSFLEHPQFPEVPRQLTLEEIVKIVADFGQAARRAREAGFDFLQLHGAHGYLINQFLSPGTNHRTDRYGGGLRMRFRFLQEVLASVQGAVGPEYPVAIKLNGADYVDGGLDAADAEQVAEWLGMRGLCFIEVSGGTPGSGAEGPARTQITSGENEAYFRESAAAIKRRVPCPVALVGGLRSLETVERLLMDNGADLLSLARPLLWEPDLPSRWQAGDRSPAKCISCNRCFGPGVKGEGVRCVVRDAEQGEGAG
ncbi:MAG TPA: NADH:flavin oxidoreductase [Deferrisomatales bacterium]|nr:NADH:flavin oxidoreductase [Deferrisomatales bacterium]